MTETTYEERRAAEKAQARAEVASFHAKMRKVAEILGLELVPSLDMDTGEPYTNGPADLVDKAKSIHIDVVLDWRNRSKASATGSYPDGSRYGRDNPKINFSLSKTAEQIAKDIERRLMPEYLPELEKARESVRQHEEYQHQKDAAGKRFAQILGTEYREGKDDTIRIPMTSFYGDVKVSGGDHNSIELRSLSTKQAEEILTLVAKFQRRERNAANGSLAG